MTSTMEGTGDFENKDVDSEWEYEYDETENEDIYVVLDLSSYISEPLAGRPQLNVDEFVEETLDPSLAGQSKDLDGAQIQIMELESDRPFVSYKGQVFECSWGNTLGTDMIFCKPNESPASIEPSITDTRFHLLTTSRLKLVGKPVTLQAKEDVLRERIDENPASGQLQPGVNEKEKGSRDVVVPVGPDSSEAKQQQAAFLGRLIAAKVARGEEDKVFLSKSETYDYYPPGQAIPSHKERPRKSRQTKQSTVALGEQVAMLPPSIPTLEQELSPLLTTEQTASNSPEASDLPRNSTIRGQRVGRPRGRGRGTPRPRMTTVFDGFGSTSSQTTVDDLAPGADAFQSHSTGRKLDDDPFRETEFTSAGAADALTSGGAEVSMHAEFRSTEMKRTGDDPDAQMGGMD